MPALRHAGDGMQRLGQSQSAGFRIEGESNRCQKISETVERDFAEL